MVERTLAWLVRPGRRVAYRGTARNRIWLAHRAAAINLQRLLNLGLTHDRRLATRHLTSGPGADKEGTTPSASAIQRGRLTPSTPALRSVSPRTRHHATTHTSPKEPVAQQSPSAVSGNVCALHKFT